MPISACESGDDRPVQISQTDSSIHSFFLKQLSSMPLPYTELYLPYTILTLFSIPLLCCRRNQPNHLTSHSQCESRASQSLKNPITTTNHHCNKILTQLTATYLPTYLPNPMSPPQASPETSAAIQRLPPALGASLLDTWWHASSDPTFAQLIAGLNAYLDAIPIPHPSRPPSGIPLSADAKAAFWRGVESLRDHPLFANFVQRLVPYLETLESQQSVQTLIGTQNGVVNGGGGGGIQLDGALHQLPVLANGNGADGVPSGCKRPLVEVDGSRPASEYAGTKKERLTT